MQMVKKSLFLLFIGWMAFLIFMPKTELYYTLEKQLAQKDIRLNEGSIEEGMFTLRLKNVTLYVKGIALAQIKEIECFTVLFYSHLRVKSIEVERSLQEKLPQMTTELSMTHVLLSPNIVSLDANGSFGTVEGKMHLLSKKIHLDFTSTQNMDMLKPFLQKNEKGWYYERTF